MAVELREEARKQLVDSIKRFFRETMEEDYGELRAGQVLDFCLEEIGPSIYNQAIADAQAFFREKTEDLEETCWEPELTYWSKKR